MIDDIELLNHMHQNADMAKDSIKNIISISNDANFIKALNKQFLEYQNTLEITKKLLDEKNANADQARTFSKIMARISCDLKTLKDHSTRKFAEMMIQGSTMGISNLKKQIENYNGTDTKVVELANKQVDMEQTNIDEMQKFL